MTITPTTLPAALKAAKPELSLLSKQATTSDILASQALVIRQQEHVIEVLKGALAGASVAADIPHAPWMEGLTPQERALIGVLLGCYPKHAPGYLILDALPGKIDLRDREVQLVTVLVSKARRRFGSAAIETVKGLGYRLGSAFRDGLLADEAKLAAARAALS